MSKTSDLKMRKRTRRMVLQALYQWHVNRQHTSNIEKEFHEEHAALKVDWDTFHTLFCGVVSMSDQLDKELEPLLNRTLSELDPVELSLLRMSSFELHERLDIPLTVILNESIDLAHAFGATDSYKLINAVLDRLCSQLPLRKAEKQKRL